MTRQITSHKCLGLNDQLDINAVDEPGQGNANAAYNVYHPLDAFNEELNASMVCSIRFQSGTLADVGVNGVTNEALLAIVADRLSCFQAGEFRCRENAIALTKIEEALLWLHKRTRDRFA